MYNNEKIKSLMERYNISGCDLAKMLKKSRDYVYGWRTGAKMFKPTDEFMILYKLKMHYGALLRLAEKEFNAINEDPGQLID
jgi:hypothetical protein